MRPILTPLALSLSLLLAACGGDQDAAPDGDAAAPAQDVADAGEAQAAPEEAPMPRGDFRVVAVELGTELDEEGRVPRPQDVFTTVDTIHAAVVGVGSSPGLTLSARWLLEDGTQVAKAGQSLVPEVPTVTTFSITQPEPWPAGSYRVEIAINDRVVETRSFTIE
ncbi:hypothetical protein [uncultured Arenimonas sp.]|uniref:hypothetical protein n=1 Tax=uncultured Arenimonas sp. TaxID=546226 RepID=UPI0030D9DCFE